MAVLSEASFQNSAGATALPAQISIITVTIPPSIGNVTFDMSSAGSEPSTVGVTLTPPAGWVTTSGDPRGVLTSNDTTLTLVVTSQCDFGGLFSITLTSTGVFKADFSSKNIAGTIDCVSSQPGGMPSFKFDGRLVAWT